MRAKKVAVAQNANWARWLFRITAALMLTGVVWQLIVALPPLYTDPAYRRDDYRAIVTRITTSADENTVVILNAPGQSEVFGYYAGDALTSRQIPAGLNDTDEQIRAATENIIDTADAIYAVLWGEAERDPNRVVERTLDSAAFEVSNTWYGDVRLARYVTVPDTFAIRRDADTQFGDHIMLQSYALSDTALAPGDLLHVQLQWQADASIDTRYKVTVQLLDENGMLIAQRDTEPVGGSSPTTTWQPRQTITDNHALLVPQDVDAANITLILALYNPADSNTRLSVSAPPGDSLTLATITIHKPEADE